MSYDEKLSDLKKEKERLVGTLENTSIADGELESTFKAVKKSRKELRGLNAPALTNISTNELFERFGAENAPALMIDVRTHKEYNSRTGHIDNTKLIPLKELKHKLDSLGKYIDEEIVVICHRGSRSMTAARLLVRAGFKDVRNLTGGMLMWHRKGYPVLVVR